MTNLANMKLYKSEAWLKNQLQRKQRKPADVAAECDVSLMTIYRYMEKFGIRR